MYGGLEIITFAVLNCSLSAGGGRRTSPELKLVFVRAVCGSVFKLMLCSKLSCEESKAAGEMSQPLTSRVGKDRVSSW